MFYDVLFFGHEPAASFIIRAAKSSFSPKGKNEK